MGCIANVDGSCEFVWVVMFDKEPLRAVKMFSGGFDSTFDLGWKWW